MTNRIPGTLQASSKTSSKTENCISLSCALGKYNLLYIALYQGIMTVSSKINVVSQCLLASILFSESFFSPLQHFALEMCSNMWLMWYFISVVINKDIALSIETVSSSLFSKRWTRLGILIFNSFTFTCSSITLLIFIRDVAK